MVTLYSKINTYRNGFAGWIQRSVESGATLRQKLIWMSARVEWEILGSDGTVRRNGLLELVMEVGHAHGQVLGMHSTMGLLILTTGTDGRTRAM